MPFKKKIKQGQQENYFSKMFIFFLFLLMKKYPKKIPPRCLLIFEILLLFSAEILVYEEKYATIWLSSNNK